MTMGVFPRRRCALRSWAWRHAGAPLSGVFDPNREGLPIRDPIDRPVGLGGREGEASGVLAVACSCFSSSMWHASTSGALGGSSGLRVASPKAVPGDVHRDSAQFLVTGNVALFTQLSCTAGSCVGLGRPHR